MQKPNAGYGIINSKTRLFQSSEKKRVRLEMTSPAETTTKKTSIMILNSELSEYFTR